MSQEGAVTNKSTRTSQDSQRQSERDRDENASNVQLRSNVVMGENDWHRVPGDIFDMNKVAYERNYIQNEEYYYYEPCAICHRTPHVFTRDGCERYDCNRLDARSGLT